MTPFKYNLEVEPWQLDLQNVSALQETSTVSMTQHPDNSTWTTENLHRIEM